MTHLYNIWRVALYEAKLLSRSWGFRIFSGLGLIVLAIIAVAITSRSVSTPHYVSSLSGSIPLNSIKLFNIFQGIIASYLASEFFKRDRKHDTTEVIYVRSYPNSVYLLGKLAGILFIFSLLNLAILLITFIIHVFFSSTPFALAPYITYPLLICLPTLIFMTGLSFFLSSLLRSQALVFISLLAYSFLVLVFLGAPLFGLFDSYAFYLPLMWSDFIGLGNIGSILLIRLSYLFLGLGLIFVCPLLFKRLRQSELLNKLTASFAAFCLLLGVILAVGYTSSKFSDREYRNQLRESSQGFHGTPTASVRSYDIQFEHSGEIISVRAQLELTNDSPSPLHNLLMTLNPGLRVESVSQAGSALNFQRDSHFLQVKPTRPLEPNRSISLIISYSGRIDERYCFLDIEDDRIESRYRLWIYDIPKRYAIVSSDYVHLTPESGWYPVAGLPPGAAYPSLVAPSYSRYSLTVSTPEGLTAISQGKPEIQSGIDTNKYLFKPGGLLPKISLTIGEYQCHEIEVDKLTYSLFVRPGHDYFVPLMSDIQQADRLTELIRETLDRLELGMGVYYPYTRFSLVEVPINICSYQRRWTVAHETVQPQLTFLPEMGTICAYGQLRFPLETEMGLLGRERPVALGQMQRGVLWRFITWNLVGDPQYMGEADVRTINRMRHNRIGLNVRAEIETQFDLFPNFFSFNSQVVSGRWPVLNYALESYLRDRVTAPMPVYGGGNQSGLSSQEEINQLLMNSSLAEIIDNPDLEAAVVQRAIAAKGQTLMALIEARTTVRDFEKKLTKFADQQRGGIISEKEMTEFFSGLGDIDFAEIVDSWYSNNHIPGFILGDVEVYDLIEGERTRTQVKFPIANPTSVDGIAKVRLRDRPSRRGGAPPDIISRVIFLPARTSKQVGLVSDEPPARLTVETFISQNIPSSVNIPFYQNRALKDDEPFRGELVKPYQRSDFFPENEIIVDNVDPGFEILGRVRQNWLSRMLQNLFHIKNEVPTFSGGALLYPPSLWTQSTNQDFFGELVHSLHMKKSGKGKERVVWNVEISVTGEYDIFFYEGISKGLRQGIRQRQQEMSQRSGDTVRKSRGKKFFSISVRNGTEDVEYDLDGSEFGWNLIGTFSLSAGENRVELSDKNDLPYVLADAIKWLKK